MSLNRIRDIFADEIQDAAQALSERLPLTAPQLRQAFKDEELKELRALIDEVDAAADDNEKIAKIQEKAASALKLLRGLGVGF
jgi:hypothetical protein